jgi:hypothetical protein
MVLYIDDHKLSFSHIFVDRLNARIFCNRHIFADIDARKIESQSIIYSNQLYLFIDSNMLQLCVHKPIFC